MAEVLRAEIEKLGGDEGDFELVANVDKKDAEVVEVAKDDQEFDLAEFAAFHAKLKFGDSGMRFLTQKKEKDPVAKVEPKQEAGVVVPAPVKAPVVVEEPTPPEYVEEKVIKALMGSIVRKPKPRKKPLLPQGDEAEVWHYSLNELYKKVKVNEDFVAIRPECEFVRALKTKAAALVEQESQMKTKSLREFVATASESGTAKDKAAALVLKITNGAVASVAALEQLVALCKKKVRRNFILCGSLLRDVFLSDLLPLDRPLNRFHERGQLLMWSAKNQTHPQSDAGLMLAWYEDKLNDVFSEFVGILESAMSDPVDKAKELALELAASMLEAQPQEEDRLLALLTNKLGDPKPRIAQKATQLLIALLRKHPNMQPVIVAEAESVLYRSNQASESACRVLGFLNQMVFSSERHEVPTRLLNLYFGFFAAEVAKKGKLNQKLLLALLTGVNRAFPFAKRDTDDAVTKNTDQLYKLVHQGTFVVALQSLSLLHQALNQNEEPGDRFYNSLYSLLLRPEVQIESKRHTMLLNLVYRTVSSDVNLNRQKSFIKRLLMVATLGKTPFQAAVLVLLGELLREKRPLRALLKPGEGVGAGVTSTVGGAKFNAKQEPEDDESSEEEFVDADKEENKKPNKTKKGWDHREAKEEKKSFDPWARNPSYAGSEETVAWEMATLTRHYHPSVKKFADDINAKSKERYPGDPLSDFTTIRFLDRFVYKNPRKLDHEKKSSVNSRRRNNYLDTTQLPVTSLTFLQTKEDELPPADRYLHRFFQLRSNGGLSAAQITSENDGTAAVDVDDDEFDKILDDQLKGWENKMAGVDFKLASAKQRKQLKKNRSSGDQFEELNDEEFDLGEIYSDSGDDEGSDQEELQEEAPKKKRKKVDEGGVATSAEAIGAMLDHTDENTQSADQSKWERKRMNQSGKRKSHKRAKRSKLLN